MDFVEVVTDLVADELGEMADSEFLASANIDQVIIAGFSQLDHQADEIVDVDEFALLVAITPKNDLFAVAFAAKDFADQVKNEVQLPVVCMVAGPIKCGRDEAKIAHAKLLLEGEQADVEHALGVSVSEEAFNGISEQIIFLRKFPVGRIGATGADGDELGLRLALLPPS